MRPHAHVGARVELHRVAEANRRALLPPRLVIATLATAAGVVGCSLSSRVTDLPVGRSVDEQAILGPLARHQFVAASDAGAEHDLAQIELLIEGARIESAERTGGDAGVSFRIDVGDTQPFRTLQPHFGLAYDLDVTRAGVRNRRPIAKRSTRARPATAGRHPSGNKAIGGSWVRRMDRRSKEVVSRRFTCRDRMTLVMVACAGIVSCGAPPPHAKSQQRASAAPSLAPREGRDGVAVARENPLVTGAERSSAKGPARGDSGGDISGASHGFQRSRSRWRREGFRCGWSRPLRPL